MQIISENFVVGRRWLPGGVFRTFAIAVFLALLAGCDREPIERIDGAGATFLSDLVAAWITGYEATNPDVRINFSATGSGRGLDLFARGAVDFAFSELSPDPDVLPDTRFVRAPVAAGALVVAFHLDGVASLRLSRAALAGIFLGRITRWDDPLIAAENPGLDLPAIPVTVVHREDSSGSSFVFSFFLSAISPDWRDGPGTGSVVHWPVGLGALGSAALLRQIQYVEGAVGYVDLGRATESSGIGLAVLENKSGAYVAPSDASVEAAVSAAQDLATAGIIDPEGPEQVPLTVVSYFYMLRTYSDAETAEGVAQFADYILSEGGALDGDYGFVTVPYRFRAAAHDAITELAP